MKKTIFFLAFLALTCGQFLTPAQAQIPTHSENTLVRLHVIPERNTIHAGEEIWIGIEQLIKPDWHTYWKNPGDSGSAPTIDWDLPAGFEISALHWPTPSKIPYPPLLNYGYSDQVTLLQKLKAPENLPEGALTLTTDIEILVCKDECIPVFDTLSVTLNDPDAEPEDNTTTLATTRAYLPQQENWALSAHKNGEMLELAITLPEDHGLSGDAINTAAFIPDQWGILTNTAPVTKQWDAPTRTLILSQKKGERNIEQLDKVSGVLTFKTHNFLLGFEISNAPDTTPTMAAETKASQPANTPNSDTILPPATILKAAFAALLGGIILNLMPCVFPVLSIKALSLVKIAAHKPRLARLHGLSYGAGVIMSFLAIAGLLITLQAGGAAIGWGFQLQNPTVIALLAYLFFIIGLNLGGVFDISGHFGNIGNRLTQGDNLTSAFFTGILATLVATPCTAPFMGVAIGIALTQPAAVALMIFAMLGAGLALPYVALSFAPALQKRLPKPGKWMETFRQILAFPMFASAIWLLWVLSQQINEMGVLMALSGMVLLGFAFWLIQHSTKPQMRILALLAIILSFLSLPTMTNKHMGHTAAFGAPYSETALQSALQTKNPAFVEMTAAWCITCKVNHAVAINTDKTKDLFERQNVIYLIGDWTNKDEMITHYLKTFGRSGVPLYVFYGAPDAKTHQRPEPVILPQLLTPNIVTKTVMHTNTEE